MPLDGKTPLNMDIGAYLQPKTASESMNDLDLINEALKQHILIDNIMTRRQRNMRVVLKWWQ